MKALKAFLKKRIDRILQQRGYRLEKSTLSQIRFFDTLLEEAFGRSTDFVFIQIGANDGVTFDPLYPFLLRHPNQARGVVVEPMRDKFQILRRHYKAFPRVIPVNAAIHNSEQTMLLYRVHPEKERQLPMWSQGIASFNPHHHQLSGIPSKNIVAEEVTCFSIPEVVDRFQLAKIDLLVTDTEGYDYEILTHFNFDRFTPRLIHFEHGLSSKIMTWEQFRHIVDILHRNGYSTVIGRYDAIAFRQA